VSPVSSIDEIVALYALRGGRTYGEGVTQTEHALQCAMQAEAAGASPQLVIASLLHDIGHLLVDPDDLTVDDRHEQEGARALETLFYPAVFDPVGLHVSAKRYLCRTEPAYLSGLSRASQASLALQGGAFDEAEARAFERLPHWRDAVSLRRFDDMGKRDESANRAFVDYIPLMRDLAIDPARNA
jgi:phosphonate degradation associated HDIG domain protein